MRRRVWRRERPPQPRGTGWLEDVAVGVGVLVLAAFTIFGTSLVLDVVGGDALEAAVWRTLVSLALLRWMFRRVGWV